MLPKPIPDKLPGTVLPQYVTCGNSGCHCMRGELHGPYYYRFWHEGGYKLRKQYVRKADVEAVRAACAAYQQENREGRELIKTSDSLTRWLEKGRNGRYNARREVDNTLALGGTVNGLIEYAGGEKGSLAVRLRAFDRLIKMVRASEPKRRDYSSLLLGK